MRGATVSAIIATLAVILISSTSAAITRGEVEDRRVASEVARCAKGYIQRYSSGSPNTELWIMCLHASSELARRDKIDVARQVIRREGYNVFEIEDKPGWFGNSEPKDLTVQMIDRIKRGE